MGIKSTRPDINASSPETEIIKKEIIKKIVFFIIFLGLLPLAKYINLLKQN